MAKAVGRPAGVDSAATREAILAAAQRLFARQGFSETTVAQIARDAGLTAPAVHFHYKDKQTIFEVVFRRINDASFEAAQQDVAAQDTFEEKFATLLECVGRSLRSHRGIESFLVTATLEIERHDVLRHLGEDRRWIDLYRHVVATGVEEGAIAASDEHASRGVLSAMLRGLSQAAVTGSAPQSQRLFHGYQRLVRGELLRSPRG